MIRFWSRPPPMVFQHGRILLRTPSISLAVTTVARLGAAGAWRVTCCTGLGWVSGVCCFCGDCLFFRMSSIIESTLGLGTAGLGGCGLGGAGFGGLGGFVFWGGYGSLVLRAFRSAARLGASGLGFSAGGGGRGLACAVSTLGFSGAGGGSADLGGGALVASSAIGTSLGCGGGLPTLGAAAFWATISKSTMIGSGSMSGGRLKKSRFSTAAPRTTTCTIADTIAGMRISTLSG